MPSVWMLRSVDHARTDVLEERSASIIRATRIGELGTRKYYVTYYFFGAYIDC
jgi:hypothetical protein